MDTHLQLRNKTLVSPRKSRRSIQGFKSLGITRKVDTGLAERRKERYRRISNLGRERYRKRMGLDPRGRKRRRRR